MAPEYPIVLGFFSIVFYAGVGIWPTRKVIHMIEARSEMRENSPGRLRAIGGWSMAAIWAVFVLFTGSFAGDWAYTGDFEGASARAAARFEILIHILIAIAESD